MNPRCRGAVSVTGLLSWFGETSPVQLGAGVGERPTVAVHRAVHGMGDREVASPRPCGIVTRSLLGDLLLFVCSVFRI